jgi:aspartyl-tRNA(Asn)/glutamyl-tRNA(Gln) amidotransferase subunit C
MVTKDQVKHLGWLSRIDLSDSELERYTMQVEEIIKYLDKLDSIPLEKVEPIKAKKKFSDLRDDQPQEFAGDAIVTPHRKDGFVKGPRML